MNFDSFKFSQSRNWYSNSLFLAKRVSTILIKLLSKLWPILSGDLVMFSILMVWALAFSLVMLYMKCPKINLIFDYRSCQQLYREDMSPLPIPHLWLSTRIYQIAGNRIHLACQKCYINQCTAFCSNPFYTPWDSAHKVQRNIWEKNKLWVREQNRLEHRTKEGKCLEIPIYY